MARGIIMPIKCKLLTFTLILVWVLSQLHCFSAQKNMPDVEIKPKQQPQEQPHSPEQWAKPTLQPSDNKVQNRPNADLDRASSPSESARPSRNLQTITEYNTLDGLPRVQVRPPISGPKLKIYEFLPKKLFFYGSLENSYRYESNPFQARARDYPYNGSATAYRLQGDATLGYAFTPRTKVSLGYFGMMNRYDNFGSDRLDGSVHSFSGALDHVIWTNDNWSLRGGLTARHAVTGSGRQSGDILSSLTLTRGLGNNAWAFANASVNMGRQHFFAGNDYSGITPILTIGTGYAVPWKSEKTWQKILKGITFNLSSTYSFANHNNASLYRPSNPQSSTITLEATRPITRRSPLVAFCRFEPSFNFGNTNDGVIGYSPFNYRVFGGLRFSIGKSPVFTSPLN